MSGQYICYRRGFSFEKRWPEVAVFIFENLTDTGHPDVFSEYKVKTHLGRMLRRPPRAPRYPHGFTRTRFNNPWRVQRSVLTAPPPRQLVRLEFWPKTSFCPRYRWPLLPPSPASAPPPEGRRPSQDGRDSTSIPSGGRLTVSIFSEL